MIFQILFFFAAQAAELPNKKLVLRVERTDTTGLKTQQALIFTNNGGKLNVRLVANSTTFCEENSPMKTGVFEGEAPGEWETDYRLGHQLAIRLDRAKDDKLERSGPPHGNFYYLNEYWVSPGSNEAGYLREVFARACKQKNWKK